MLHSHCTGCNLSLPRLSQTFEYSLLQPQLSILFFFFLSVYVPPATATTAMARRPLRRGNDRKRWGVPRLCLRPLVTPTTAAATLTTPAAKVGRGYLLGTVQP